VDTYQTSVPWADLPQPRFELRKTKSLSDQNDIANNRKQNWRTYHQQAHGLDQFTVGIHMPACPGGWGGEFIEE
jgi:hypothetical protein